jgi:large subunit ribosomal protein L28e
VLVTKKKNRANKPATELQKSTISGSTSTRKTYRAVVNSTTRRHYRIDLRKDAVARASAIRKSQRPSRADPPKKARGAKAKKAE